MNRKIVNVFQKRDLLKKSITIYLTTILIFGVFSFIPSVNAEGIQLVDSDFNFSINSEDLINNSVGQDWYESRNDTPSLLTLDTSDVKGNTGKKAALNGFDIGTSAYLSQEFNVAQEKEFNVSIDIYIDKISNYNSYDRSGYIFIGDDSSGSNGPCSTSSERFVFLTFYDSTPGDSGDDIEIRARTSLSQSWSNTSNWTTVTTGLSYDSWYVIKLIVNVSKGGYDVYVNDILKGENISGYETYASSSVTDISFSVGGTARGDFFVDNVFIPSQNRFFLDSTVNGDGSVNINPGESTYSNGTIVELEAVADMGWTFSHWSGDLSSGENPVNISINADKSIIANFNRSGYSLNINLNGKGSVVKNPDKQIYIQGEIVELTAIADTNFTFDVWSDDLSGNNNPINITMDDDKTVTANFDPDYLLIDSEFKNSLDSVNLRLNATSQDWYESRNNDTSVLTLDTTEIAGNTGKKAALKGFESPGYAYLSQEFATAQSDRFNLSFDVFIDRIEDYGDYDRAGYIYIGDDSQNYTSSDAGKGPCSTSRERFSLLTFFDNGGTGSNLQIMAREFRHDNPVTPQPWADTSTWTLISADLEYDTWHRIKLDLDINNGTYDVYVDDILEGNDINGFEDYSSSSVEHISFSAGGTGRGDMYIDNVFNPSSKGYRIESNSVGGGTVLINPGEARYKAGTLVEFNASANSGWSFDHWEGDLYGDTNPISISINEDLSITAVFITGNVIPTVQTDNVTDITNTSANLHGYLIDDGGENNSVWFEWDQESEIMECIGVIATGSVSKDGRSILHKNRHYKKDNQRPRFFQGINFSYFGVGNDNAPTMNRMGQNEKGLAIANADVSKSKFIDINNLIDNTTNYFSDRSSLEDNDKHHVLGNYDTVKDAALWIATHSAYHGNYWIISSEPGVGAIVCVDISGNSTITWINNSYAAIANVFYCNGGHDTDWGPNDVTAEIIMRDIVENSTSSDSDNLLNWQDISQRIAKNTRDKEDGNGTFYVKGYGGEISNGAARSAIVCVAGDPSFNSSIHMSWLAFGKTTQISIFLPLYAGNLSSVNDIPYEFGDDSGSNPGIQPFVDVKEAYANEGLSTEWYHCDRVREIQKYAFYNENITFNAFDNLMNTISSSADEQEAETHLTNLVNDKLPIALDGYINNISTSSSFTEKQYPFRTDDHFNEIINDLSPGTVYSVIAHANNSVYSSDGDQILFMTRPNIPYDVHAETHNDTQINITWNKGIGANNTIIERNTVPSWIMGAGNEIYNGTGDNYKDIGLVAGGQYFYQLWSYASSEIGLNQNSMAYSIVDNTTTGTLVLLVDSNFNDNENSTDLRFNSLDQDWYESRNDNQSLLTLDTSEVNGNSGKKTALKNYGIENNAYLTQELSIPQTGRFNVSLDINIDRIENNSDFDRTGIIYIGDNSISTDNPPTGMSDERFVFLTFYDSTPGDSGDDLEIKARTTSGNYDNTGAWTTVETNLSYDTWYSIKIELDVASGTYDVYIDGIKVGNNISKYNGFSSNSITHVSFVADSDGRGDFYVDNVFAPAMNQYTLDVDIVGNGSVIINPDKSSYSKGSIVELEAVADTGWTFVNWDGDLTGNTNPDIITIEKDMVITATFTKNNCALIVNTIGNGAGVVNRDISGPYHYGDIVELTAVPDAGSEFTVWADDLTGSINPDNITITGEMNVDAEFTLIEYALNTNINGSGGGTIELSSSGPYHYGDVVTVWANASVGSVFTGWYEDLTGTTSPEAITIDGNKDITAEFMLNDYTLTITTIGNGTVKTNPEQSYYTYGDVVELEAIANETWVFNNWSGSINSSINQTSIIIDNDEIVTAYFSENITQPDNNPPEFSSISITNGTTGVSIDTSTLSMYIEDIDDDWINWTIETSPDIGSNYGENDSNGVKTCNISGLSYSATYTWFVSANDGMNWTNASYWFTTEDDSSSTGGGDSSGSGGGGGGFIPPSDNEPIADTNGPYVGFVGLPILFNGSNSSDDGIIELYQWNFGDNNEGSGVSTTHSYVKSGNYTLTLTITDNGGKTNTDTSNVIISENINNPPEKPILKGVNFGIINSSYMFSVKSTDEDQIKYVFNWGDETSTISDLMDSDIDFEIMHKWINAGIFTVKVYAEDEDDAKSETVEMIVLINALFVKDIGYLLDLDNDGTYDSFKDNITGFENDIRLQNDGIYLLDTDNNGNWDYSYNTKTDNFEEYINENMVVGQQSEGILFLFLIAIPIIIVSILLLIVILIKKEKLNL